MMFLADTFQEKSSQSTLGLGQCSGIPPASVDDHDYALDEENFVFADVEVEFEVDAWAEEPAQPQKQGVRLASGVKGIPARKSSSCSSSASGSPATSSSPAFLSRSSSRASQPTSGKRKSISEEDSSADIFLEMARAQVVGKVTRSADDKYSAYGKHVADQLREMGDFEAAMARVEIEQVFLKYHTKNPNRPTL